MIDQPMDAVEEVLGELPMPCFVTAEDVQLAVRAVVDELVARGDRHVRVPDRSR
ncbi:hypothetical protein [Micromonospora rhizosphaerae]|uniref:hypothetical protein n=1 Tax=Micromonospora rhizosphaerae TaxID=568872 RepID=UPI00159F0858|nr:hypothetical protein [Micromonospora rhizosphaerae]